MTRKTIARASVGDMAYRKERGKFIRMGRIVKKESKGSRGYSVTLDDDGHRITYSAGGSTVVWIS